MKTLIVLLFAGFLFTAKLERGEVSYRIQNETADTLFADAWINGSCFHMVKKIIPPGTTREIYGDIRTDIMAKENFEKHHENVMSMLSIYRYADYRKLFKPGSTQPGDTGIDTSFTPACMPGSQQHWHYHARPGNRGIALLKVKESDLLK